tara:strand:+ start:1101 stop:1880 length:780 start_codon:yes stop_codon:yes gene_type:complete
MTSELKVDKITPASGTNTQIGESGDTTDLSAGTVTLPTSIITGQTEKTSLVDADKFLISDSAASGALKYVQNSNLGGGGLVHITSQAFPSANNFTIDSVFSADYVNYIMMINMLNCTTDDSLDFVFVKSGTPDTGSNYRYTIKGYSNSGSDSSAYSSGTTTYGRLIHDMDADSEAGASGTYTIFSPFAAYQRKHVSGLIAVQKNTANNTAPYYLASDYHNGTTQQFTGIKFQSTIGHNFRAGSVSGGYSSVSIYGVKNS